MKFLVLAAVAMLLAACGSAPKKHDIQPFITITKGALPPECQTDDDETPREIPKGAKSGARSITYATQIEIDRANQARASNVCRRYARAGF